MKRRRSLPVRLLRAAAGSLIVVLLLCFLLLLGTQTAWFRDFARATIVELADSSLNASLSIGSLDGDIFSGWRLGDVRLRNASGEIARIRSVNLRYSLLGLPWKRVTIKELTITQPRITITRPAGGEWNIAHLLRDTTESEPGGGFDWHILATVRIDDGRLTVVDSGALPAPGARPRFTTSCLRLDNIRLGLTADITDAAKRISLNQLSFTNAPGHVPLENIAGDLALTRRGAAVEHLSVQTAASSLVLDARIDGIDLAGGFSMDSLRRAPLRVALRSKRVLLSDLQYFLPALDILGGEAALALRGEGTLDRLAVRQCELRAANSSIALAGTLERILDGADMRLDIAAADTRLQPADLPLLLPGIPLPDYSGAGLLRCRALRYTGSPRAFTAEVDAACDAGSVAGRCELDLRGGEFVYAIEASVTALNLGRILAAPGLASSITAAVSLRGSGTEPGRMQAEAAIDAVDSRFRNYAARALRARVAVAGDSLTAEGSVDSPDGAGRFALRAGFAGGAIDGCALVADVANLDLGRLTGSDSLRAVVTGGADLAVTSFDLEKASGHARFALRDTRIDGLRIAEDSVRIELDQRDSVRHLLAATRYGTVRVDGRFSIPRFIAYAAEQADSIAAGLQRRALFAEAPAVDTTPGGAASPAGAAPAVAPRHAAGRRGAPGAERDAEREAEEFMDATYSVAFDTTALRELLGADRVFIRGGYAGTIRGGARGMAVSGAWSFPEVYLDLPALRFRALKLEGSFRIGGLALADPLRSARLALTASSDETIVNGMMLRKTQVDLQQRGDSTQFELRNIFRNLLDTAVSVYLSGTGVLHESSYQAALRRCSLSYLGFGWTNASPVLLRVDTAGVAVDAMTLRRNATTVTLTGSRSFEGAYNAGLVIDSLQLQELEYLLSRSKEALAGRSFRGTMHLEANLTGTDARPEIAVEVAIPNLAYMNNPLGMFEAEPRYQPGMLEVYSRLRYGSGGGPPRDVFTANGYYPLAFSLGGAGEAGADTASSYRLLVGMNDFPLEIVEKFATPFSSLRGTANAELLVHKVDGLPALSGGLEVAAARGRFAMNNMNYLLDLRLTAEPGLLRLDTLRIANDPREWNRGVLIATGDVSLDGLAVRAYEVDIDGRLKILSRASRTSLKVLYGDLFFSTGESELRFMGDKRGASFTGDLRIDQGDLIYNPNAGGAADAQRTRISFLDVDDRTSSKETSLSAAAETNGAAEEEDAAADGGFLRQFTYALDVSTLGALRLSMPISALSQAELNARLDVSGLEVNNLDGEAKFIGVVTLGPESDFLMLGTKFVATGSITFSGDPQNPDLGLRAVYTNTHEDPVTREKRKACAIITIGGTLLKPEIAWDLRWDTPESQQRPRGGDVQSDALSFILLGLFSDELTSSSGNPLLDKLDAVSTALTSGLISKGMSDIINRVGLQDVFKRVELGGIGSNDTRVKLTSEIGRVLISYDGRVNDLTSSEIVFELPMNVLFPYSWFGPLVFQASAKTTGSSIESASSSQTEPVYEVKLLYRITF